MKPQLLTSIAAFTLGLACLPLAFPTQSFAQGSGASDPVISTTLTLQNEDVRTAVQSLCKAANVSYRIAPEVQGNVSMSVRNVPFSVALQSLVRQVGATYTLRDGVYEISKSDVRTGAGDLNTLTTVELNNEDVRTAVRVLCQSAGMSYQIAPEVQGSVTLRMKNVSFATALTSMVRQVDAKYTLHEGVLQITRGDAQAEAVEAPEPVQTRRRGSLNLEVPAANDRQTAITQDSRFLYIVMGDRIMKVRKDNLDVVAVKPLPAKRPITGGGKN